MQFIDLKAQYENLKPRIDRRIQDVLRHGQFIMGPEVSELEAKLSDFSGVKHAITCANGTDALQLALMALGIGPGDAVFTTTFTFFATAEVVALVGATPVFVDIDEQTFNISPGHLEERIEDVYRRGELNPSAIIAVDLFGLPADYGALEPIARKHGLRLVEDGAQSFGAHIGGRRTGSFGDAATTSFFPAKPLGCYGDGGAVFTNDDGLAELIKSYRIHGQGIDKYDNVRIGMNSRLDTIQAAILLEKLIEFPSELERRTEIAELYDSKLPDSCQRPVLPSGFQSAWAQYTVRSGHREQYMRALDARKIPTSIYYRKCMHQQPAFRGALAAEYEFPVAEKVAEQVFSVPMHPYLSDGDIAEVVACFSD